MVTRLPQKGSTALPGNSLQGPMFGSKPNYHHSSHWLCCVSAPRGSGIEAWSSASGSTG